MKTMEYSLAIAMAGQVSTGLTPGDNELEHARGALTALGLMLLNATENDETIRDVLQMSEQSRITVSSDGMSQTYTPSL